MTTRDILKGSAMGVLLWFFGALYFGVLVEAALPTWSDDLRTMASAAFLPMALVGALVMVKQGLTAALTRLTAALAGGGIAWFVLAWAAGAGLAAVAPRRATPATLRLVNVVTLAAAFGLCWWISGTWTRFRATTE